MTVRGILDADLAALFAPPVPAAAPSPLGSLVHRPMLYSRNGVAWACARAWSVEAKAHDIAALRHTKALPLSPVLADAADEVAAVARRLVGRPTTVTTVPCGHSRRADCFGKQLAVAVANGLDAPFVQCFADRFVSGSSHPKEFAKLAPLRWQDRPLPGLVLVVDDVATSGWHMEESLTALRAADYPAVGLAWISGTVRGEAVETEIDWTGALS